MERVPTDGNMVTVEGPLPRELGRKPAERPEH